MAFKLDIFELLGKINDPHVGDIYTKLSDDEKKGFAPLVVLRWLSGTSDERQIILINEFVNPMVFSLGKHPHLLMLLLQAAASKTNKRYQWLSIKSKKKFAIATDVVKQYYNMSYREVKMLNPFPSEENVLEMAESIGLQKDELTKLKKEYKDGY